MCGRALGIGLCVVGLLIAGCAPEGDEPGSPLETDSAAMPAEPAEPAMPTAAEPGRCAEHDPLRRVYFGDLHVHTGISMDAYMFETRATPDDAYRFARGEELLLPPLDAQGQGTRPVRLARPLDFAAVTDHAHSFGGVRLCTTPGSEVYETPACERYRSKFIATDLEQSTSEIVGRVEGLASEEVCGVDGERCRRAAREVWLETQAAAERWQDSAPSCAFTTLHAYEYTNTPRLTKIHRNVFFRSSTVIDLPINSLEEPEALGLWRRLNAECNDAGTGCEALTIPHNPNLSNGQIFKAEYGEAQTPAEQAELATLRASLEPLLEMSQMKGDSECRNGMWNVLGQDELCDFEKARAPETEDCQDGTGWGALGQRGCVSRLDYARYALIEGQREQTRIGVNPYKVGFIGSTDIHDGTPGAAEEYEVALNVGSNTAGSPGMNRGSLAAVWAEENSREALFEGLKRRETYATSGPRMAVRFFGGWDYPPDLCGSHGMLPQAYARGVPMGGDLPTPSSDETSPVFVAWAQRDAGTAEHPGGLLQRIQVIKAWADDDGMFHQDVIDVSGRSDGDADVDLDTCAPRGEGAESLCGVWRDPDFDPQRPAVYYARVLENPSCRYTTWWCLAIPADERPADCAAGLPATIQERAWTSPIWYSPPLAELTQE